jgi:predicted nuclease of predicted toxin-antitoxin system
MRFKLDECIPEELAHMFQERGHESETVRGQGYAGVSDADILNVCREKRYVLVTADRGFGNIAEYPPREASGIIVIRPRPYNFLSTRRLLETLLDYIDSQGAGISLPGRLLVIDPDRSIRRY